MFSRENWKNQISLEVKFIATAAILLLTAIIAIGFGLDSSEANAQTGDNAVGGIITELTNPNIAITGLESTRLDSLRFEDGTSEVSRPDNGPSPTEGQFRTLCQYSHFAYDDPIVLPDQSGKSHLNIFFGNTEVDANTTADTLANTGGGSCQGGELNRTGYWMPALLDGRGNTKVPSSMVVYYKSKARSQAEVMPQGLELVAGDTVGIGSSKWACGSNGSHRNEQKTIPQCDDVLNAVIAFPQCWDGVNLKSNDHISHMKAINDQDDCPSSHPKRLPRIQVLVYWSNPGDTTGWHLSSDAHNGADAAPGSTLHSNWWGGWNKEVIDTWTKNCVQAARNCSIGQLGISRSLDRLKGPNIFQGSTYVGERTLKIPTESSPSSDAYSAPVSSESSADLVAETAQTENPSCKTSDPLVVEVASDVASEFNLWARYQNSSNTSNARVHAELDGQCVEVALKGLTGDWEWSEADSKINLAKGGQNVSIHVSEGEVWIDKLLFSADDSCSPKDNGSNCVVERIEVAMLGIEQGQAIEGDARVSVSVKGVDDAAVGFSIDDNDVSTGTKVGGNTYCLVAPEEDVCGLFDRSTLTVGEHEIIVYVSDGSRTVTFTRKFLVEKESTPIPPSPTTPADDNSTATPPESTGPGVPDGEGPGFVSIPTPVLSVPDITDEIKEPLQDSVSADPIPLTPEEEQQKVSKNENINNSSPQKDAPKDKEPPKLVIGTGVAPSESLSGEITLTVPVSLIESGDGEIVYTVDGEVVGTADTDNPEVTIDTGELSNRSHEFTAEVLGESGEKETAEVLVVVSNSPFNSFKTWLSSTAVRIVVALVLLAGAAVIGFYEVKKMYHDRLVSRVTGVNTQQVEYVKPAGSVINPQTYGGLTTIALVVMSGVVLAAPQSSVYSGNSSIIVEAESSIVGSHIVETRADISYVSLGPDKTGDTVDNTEPTTPSEPAAPSEPTTPSEPTAPSEPTTDNSSGKFYVVGKDIVDPNGNKFYPIGANASIKFTSYGYVFEGNNGGANQHIEEIKDWNWNIIRATLVCNNSSGTPSLDKLMAGLKSEVPKLTSQKIVVMLECHDLTGKNPTLGSAGEMGVRRFWDRAVKEFKDDPYVWFNILNEPWSKVSDPEYVRLHEFYVDRIRATGAENIVLIDAPSWGQGVAELAQTDLGTDLAAGKCNVAFEWHAYGAFNGHQGTYSEFEESLKRVQARNLALIIGEYGVALPVEFGNAGPPAWNVSGFEHLSDLGPKYGVGLLWWHATGDSSVFTTYSLTADRSGYWTSADGSGLSEYGKKFWDVSQSAKHNLGKFEGDIANSNCAGAM